MLRVCPFASRQHASSTRDEELAGRCRGALAAIGDRPASSAPPSAAAAAAEHLMISYQWGVQETVKRIAASMRARSFKVWVDTEMMSGSTLDAMAAAVEGSFCVLVCITERYKVRTPRGTPTHLSNTWHRVR